MSRTEYLFYVLGITLVFTIWEGFVLSILWSWFIVSTFHLPELSLIQASGVVLIISLITSSDYSACLQETNPGVVLMRSAQGSALVPLFALIIGWILKLFI